MNMRTMLAASTALTLTLGSVLPVAALDVSVNTNANVGVGAGNAHAQTSADVDANAGAGNATSADAKAKSASDADASSSVILITRGEIESAAHASEQAKESASDNAAFLRAEQVSTNADLSAFIKGQLKHDENLSQVQASPDSVVVTYKGHAKLFGFLPSSLSTIVIADAAGNVTLAHPWYGFFFSTEANADLAAEIEASIDAVIGANTSTAQLTAKQQAKLISDIRASLKAAADAEVSAQ